MTSLTSGVSVSARPFDDQDDPDDIDDEDREDPADTAPHEPAHGRIEQVDEEQTEDERPDAVAGHPQDEAGDEGRHDEHRDPRRERHEPRLGRSGVRVDEGRGGERGHPAGQRMHRIPSDRWRGLVHRAAD